MTDLEFLDHWFASQSNGDWEHGEGVHLVTADSPGWILMVFIEGSDLHGEIEERRTFWDSDTDFLQSSSDGLVYRVSCGVGRLPEALRRFREFAEARSPAGTLVDEPGQSASPNASGPTDRSTSTA